MGSGAGLSPTWPCAGQGALGSPSDVSVPVSSSTPPSHRRYHSEVGAGVPTPAVLQAQWVWRPPAGAGDTDNARLQPLTMSHSSSCISVVGVGVGWHPGDHPLAAGASTRLGHEPGNSRPWGKSGRQVCALASLGPRLASSLSSLGSRPKEPLEQEGSSGVLWGHSWDGWQAGSQGHQCRPRLGGAGTRETRSWSSAVLHLSAAPWWDWGALCRGVPGPGGSRSLGAVRLLP